MQTEHSSDGPPVYEFGWWPEFAGIAMTAVIITLMMVYARGSL